MPSTSISRVRRGQLPAAAAPAVRRSITAPGSAGQRSQRASVVATSDPHVVASTTTAVDAAKRNSRSPRGWPAYACAAPVAAATDWPHAIVVLAHA